MKQHDTTPLLSVPPAPAQPVTAPMLTPAGGKVYDWERKLLKQLFRITGKPPLSVVLWDGEEIAPGSEPPVARLWIRDRGALLKLAAYPDLEFGEMYSAGRLEVEGDLVECMETLERTMAARERRGHPWAELRARLYLMKRNTLSRARDNIYHHYDIGNEFYKLWLDERLVYTCAYFPDPALSLEQAQVAKLDHVCRKLRLKPHETVVETGCGWGALALHMAKHYGVRVKAYNISREQIAYARERVRQEGLAERVEFVEGDYRTVQGTFDVFVSVGMLEHVGLSHYRELGGVIDRCLKPDGRGLIHSIGRNRPGPMNPWIEKRVFPGGYPPSLREMMRIFEPWQLSVLDVENLRLHYAQTLRHWLARYEAAVDRVAAMFDETFVRTWRLYLAGSIAAFSMGGLQLFQVVFTRFDNNAIPWSRAFMYRDELAELSD